MPTPSLPSQPSPSRDRPYEVRIGAHFFRWEPPDTVYLAYFGDLDGPLMHEFQEVGRPFTQGQQHIFAIVDMAKCGKISSEARRASGADSKNVNFRGIAIIGASAPMRIVVGLVSRAIELMHSKADNPTRFFETEAEARNWIAARRTMLTRKS